ncbi:hypothetical protein ASPZODRAFT_13531 [Penicilliopsis zonata CBS 506.65]|uniref:Uncharacterized protein n=1 Tax=Penicilliopsis zonata CBS 506.65 TaxID=1073090 RepID=A0A1L9SNW2_9EURO|nr:hypothetical protein ASPZODRAFT_13531 [Penicilliopsis zonata CBS 506.65]OJJ48791.1 hypothetical protein ASPZODRAFT_13531 [Penicilliopsis zonata CBS 506.65]
MSSLSPTPPTPKGSRAQRRNQKRNPTPSVQKITPPLNTPPSSPPRDQSSEETPKDNGISSRKKNGARSGKKTRDVSKPSSVSQNGHRHTSSQPNVTTPQMKDSPHYAGPTFHASPAPSALPMPSFFSKSMPDSDLAPTLEMESDALEGDSYFERTPSKQKPRALHHGEDAKPTPLDFLFKAAVEARKSEIQTGLEAGAQSPLPSYAGARTPASQHKPNAIAGGFHPLESMNPELRQSPIGPAFATPYRDRMNALRSASSPTQAPMYEDEAQRKAKTEALKNLIFNPRPQRPSSASPFVTESGTDTHERAGHSAGISHFATPLRTSSGPATPVSYGSPYRLKQPNFGTGYPLQNTLARPGSNEYFPGSSLKHDISSQPTYSPERPGGRPFGSPYTSNAQSVMANHTAMYPAIASPEFPPSRVMPVNVPPAPKAVDTKQIEDDLRRILKLDVRQGVQANGVQSSLA